MHSVLAFWEVTKNNTNSNMGVQVKQDLFFAHERNLGLFQVHGNFNFDMTLLKSRFYPTP